MRRSGAPFNYPLTKPPMITKQQLEEFNSKLKDVKNVDELLGKNGS
jgi:hypothetical protein